MRITEKAKKYLAIGGGAVICIGLIVAISIQLGKSPTEKDKPQEDSSTTTAIVVSPSESTTESGLVVSLSEGTTESSLAVNSSEGTTESSLAVNPSEGTTESSLVVKPREESSSTNTEKKQSVDRRPAQTDQTEQSIQSDVTKPKSPSKETLTNPTKKPDGTKVDTPPEPEKHEKVEKPKEVPKQSNEPQGGDTKDGKVYLPGFGWVTDTGGSGTTANDMYENGSMD